MPETRQTNSCIDEIQEKIGYTFKRSSILLEALTHPSYIPERTDNIPHNQRLEFLGDSVIDIILTKEIFHLFPDYQEGKMTKIRSFLSKRSTFSRFAETLNLGKFIRLGQGEKNNQGHMKSTTLCDAFEALIGAVYIDSDNKLQEPERIILSLVREAFSPVDLARLAITENPKGMLQEWAQKHLHEQPTYKLISRKGPEHQRIYVVRVYIQNIERGIGEATRRQDAERNAAEQAVASLDIHQEFQDKTKL